MCLCPKLELAKSAERRVVELERELSESRQRPEPAPTRSLSRSRNGSLLRPSSTSLGRGGRHGGGDLAGGGGGGAAARVAAALDRLEAGGAAAFLDPLGEWSGGESPLHEAVMAGEQK